jgi:hypothetical protein
MINPNALREIAS